MTATTLSTCPHCGAAASAPGAFCDQCGKALPQAGAGPRIVEGKALASTHAGRSLQSDELRKKARSASGALLAVAILQTLGALVIFGVSYAAVQDDPTLQLEPVVFVVLGAVALFFYGLWWWARTNPLPAAIVGLLVFLTLHGAEALIDPTSIGRGIMIKVILIVVLAKAIQAGLQYRALQRAAGQV